MFRILTNNLGGICFFLWQFNMGDVLIGEESTGKRQYLPTFNFASILSYEYIYIYMNQTLSREFCKVAQIRMCSVD
jgi:hypothetical protein